jgi:hypothetical protein
VELAIGRRRLQIARRGHKYRPIIIYSSSSRHRYRQCCRVRIAFENKSIGDVIRYTPQTSRPMDTQTHCLRLKLYNTDGVHDRYRGITARFTVDMNELIGRNRCTLSTLNFGERPTDRKQNLFTFINLSPANRPLSQYTVRSVQDYCTVDIVYQAEISRSLTKPPFCSFTVAFHSIDSCWSLWTSVI